jgi:hypothetical protein
LSGCAIGEIAGMALGTWLGWSNAATIALATILAFITGYLLTMRPLLRSGLGLRVVLKTALAADWGRSAIVDALGVRLPVSNTAA